jgi:hypothetical protein
MPNNPNAVANLRNFKKGEAPGRPKGAKNKFPQAMKDLFRQALDEEGQVKYLRKVARKYPVAFTQAISRMIPEKQEREDTINIVFRHPDIVIRGRVGAEQAKLLSDKLAEAKDENA